MLTQTIYNQKDDVFFTSANDFTSAEWIEQELQQSPDISQIAVFLEAGQNVSAVIFSKIDPGTEQTSKINAAISSINASLPEYSRIQKWVYAKLPFMVKYHQITCSGSLCRNQIYNDYQLALSGTN